MTRQRHFILCHGWGFGPSFWEPLIPHLQQLGRVTTWNLGYFDEAESTFCHSPQFCPSPQFCHPPQFCHSRESGNPWIPDQVRDDNTKYCYDRDDNAKYSDDRDDNARYCDGRDDNTRYCDDRDDEELIGIGHSFGLLQLLKSQHNFQRIIGIEGFLTFHEYRQNALHLLELIKSNPQKGLEAFYKICGLESFKPPFEKANSNTLILDLHTMIEPFEKFNDHNLLFFSDVILTEHDPIVPIAMSQKQFAFMAPHVKVHRHRGHRHGYLHVFAPMLLELVTASKL
ncbi:MAG: hypothetical protein J0G29_06970 [Alphaproteobacteria bacterium]|nr:hypothetical protein [Alphaproteobacteria bacterium]OJV45302.1 MAG: hypothetical protein BGO28_00790 [Alphaproteobacteria bacterium 43-37]